MIASALCFMRHGPRRVPVALVDGRWVANCPECPREFVVADDQVRIEQDEPAKAVEAG